MSQEKNIQPSLDILLEFLRFPSISAQSAHAADVQACANWLAEKMRSLGFESRVEPTAGHPVVLARSTPDPSKRTVLFYGHYDVQPPDPLAEWQSAPFEPRIADGRVYARGSSDNKGQILAHILGSADLLAQKELPVNVVFLIEGEEEIGSPHLLPFLKDHKDYLACDALAISDTGMAADFFPTFTYATRGVACLEFRVTGPDKDLHSGIFGGAVANPVTAAARLVASLHDHEGRVAIEGFYDDVEPLADWEREAMRALPGGEEELLALAGVSEGFGEPGYTALERVGARPTAEVNGFGGGYQGEGSKTVLPKEAFVKLSFRLVAAQRAERILDLAEAHLRRHCPTGVQLEIQRGHSGEAYLMDPNSASGLAARRALKKVFGREPALLREGGTIPILEDFRSILGVSPLLLALANPDNQAHSPNENFPIRNFEAGIRLNQALLHELAS